jgi:hypothetical protein
VRRDLNDSGRLAEWDAQFFCGLPILGVFWPQDTDEGRVVWPRGRGGEKFETLVLVDHLSRVNEVQAADFDGDGDLDILCNNGDQV